MLLEMLVTHELSAAFGQCKNGPRKNPELGFVAYLVEESGQKTRQLPGSFADHYSQARQFFKIRTEIEQQHTVDALVFDFSKVESQIIRNRKLSLLFLINNARTAKYYIEQCCSLRCWEQRFGRCFLPTYTYR